MNHEPYEIHGICWLEHAAQMAPTVPASKTFYDDFIEKSRLIVPTRKIKK